MKDYFWFATVDAVVYVADHVWQFVAATVIVLTMVAILWADDATESGGRMEIGRFDKKPFVVIRKNKAAHVIAMSAITGMYIQRNENQIFFGGRALTNDVEWKSFDSAIRKYQATEFDDLRRVQDIVKDFFQDEQ